MPERNDQFAEIAHSGCTITVQTQTTPEGKRQYAFNISGSRPNAWRMYGIYALREGIPVGSIEIGGIGQSWNAPPHPSCLPVFIASDSEGYFGHECPVCHQYWRSDGAGSRWPMTCPYCGLREAGHHFLTKAQKKYVTEYCRFVLEALADPRDGDHIIDMDAVADACGKDVEKPKFYYSEERQQNRYECAACGTKNDVLGTYRYCASCGTRNDFSYFDQHTVKAVRERINSSREYGGCVRDIVSSFDSLVGIICRQLAENVPMTTGRRNRCQNLHFHQLETVLGEVEEIFGIRIVDGLSDDDVQFITRMFHRRHVYEHKGGEADEKYIRDSGDATTRRGQALQESQEPAHRTVGLVRRMLENLHNGFHEIYPPVKEPIDLHEKLRKRTGGR